VNGLGSRVNLDLLTIIITPGISSSRVKLTFHASVIAHGVGFMGGLESTPNMLGNGIGSRVKLDSLASVIASGVGSWVTLDSTTSILGWEMGPSYDLGPFFPPIVNMCLCSAPLVALVSTGSHHKRTSSQGIEP
jgi:hypothetical protein